MTPPVFVVPAADLATAVVGGRLRLSGAEGRHAVTARRLAAGETLRLVDGLGRCIDGTVAEIIDKQSLDVEVTAVVDVPPSQPRIVVVQALPKGERGELAAELLTEIGVDVIVPWSAATCVTQWKAERAERGHRRWTDAAATEVGQRVRAAALAVVLHEEATEPIGALHLPAAGEVLVVVGPEGGITAAERTVFAEAGAHEVRLGPSVLRTSSAGLAAVAALCAGSARWGIADRGGMEG